MDTGMAIFLTGCMTTLTPIVSAWWVRYTLAKENRMAAEERALVAKTLLEVNQNIVAKINENTELTLKTAAAAAAAAAAADKKKE